MVEYSLLTEEGMHADLPVCWDHIVEVSWCAGGAPQPSVLPQKGLEHLMCVSLSACRAEVMS